MKEYKMMISKIEKNIKILEKNSKNKKANLVESVMKTDVLQTLFLSEYKLKDKSVPLEEKASLCETLELLFAQVGKITNQKKGVLR